MDQFWDLKEKTVNMIGFLVLLLAFGPASQVLAQQLTSNNSRAIALYKEGLELAEQENFNEALTRLRQAIDLDPSFIQAHLRYMDAFRSVGRGSEVPGMYKNMLDKRQDSALYHFLYGRALDDLAAKRIEFRKALEIDASYYWAQFGIGGTYMLENRLDEAIVALNKALDMRPDMLDALSLLATIYMEKGMPFQARDLLEQAVAIDSGSAGLYMKLGQAYSQLEKYETAEKIFRRAAALDPDQGLIYYYIGLVCELGKQNARAVENYEKFVKLAPDHELAPAAKKNIERLSKK